MNDILWQPDADAVRATPIDRFRRSLISQGVSDIPDFRALHRWSIERPTEFWDALWEFCDVKANTRGTDVLVHGDDMLKSRWFPDARLNFAENLLRRNDDGIAIIFRSENGERRELSHAELQRQVGALSRFLEVQGVVAGDRVAAFLPNLPEAIIGMLAAASLGAIWSSCSPDFGFNGVLDRFGQIEPKVLITADGYHYAGRTHDSLEVASGLARKIESIQRVIVVPYLGKGMLADDVAHKGIAFADALDDQTTPAQFVAMPFDHPLYILFSSGTTGKPKCIVHGAGGTLLQHLKEQQLHVGVQPEQRLFFFTTCGWMMWNWLVSGLASGATLVLYDGSPFHPDGNVLFDMAQAENVAHFGTSAKFIDACNKAGVAPARTHQLPALRSILSTGSPLAPESFDYVYQQVASDVLLASMSGGTDIVACFALGNPCLPVHRGELQCLGLGMNVQVFDDEGQALPEGQKGELVCTDPFPSQPVGFFGDADGSRYRAAYFERFPGVWCHGDYVSVTPHGGLVIHGRSDAVLNPGGVRIGTAEIYRQVEVFEEILEALVIGQQWQGDVRVVLFVRMQPGHHLDDALRDRLKKHIRTEASPRHVPSRIVAVDDIPRTRSGKIVELAVRKVVHGEPVDNVEALANPEALGLFKNLEALRE